MSALPTFSIIIPTYNRAGILERTIRHFDAQDYPPERYELIVVDNSSDETPATIERLAGEVRFRLRLLRGERLPAIKRNQGLALADGEYALFFNDDVWAEPDLLKEHAATHAAYDEPIAVLGLVEQSPEMPYNAFQEAFRPFAYYDIADRVDQEVTFLYFWSMNLSLSRREMLDRNLIFHQDWAEIGHEDVELGYRWTRAGYKIVYNPRARGEHYHPYTLDSACRFAEGIGRGLRDLEWLVPERYLLQRYGVFTWRNQARAILRGLVRQALFNALTVPPLQRWLGHQGRNTALTRWMYWKVLLFYVNRAYRRAPQRKPRRLTTRPPGAAWLAQPPANERERVPSMMAPPLAEPGGGGA